MKNLIKLLSKYLCCGAATAGVTAPITYLTTRENIEENEEFKAILTEIKEKEEEKRGLDTKIQEGEKRISKLRGCIQSVSGSELWRKNPRTGVPEKQGIQIWFGNSTKCD